METQIIRENLIKTGLWKPNDNRDPLQDKKAAWEIDHAYKTMFQLVNSHKNGKKKPLFIGY